MFRWFQKIILIFIEWIKKNIIFFIFFVVLLFSVYLVKKLYDIQILQGEKYNKIVLSKVSKKEDNRIKERGSIFFNGSNKKKNPVALQKIFYELEISPKIITDSQKTYEELSKIIFINKTEFYKKVLKKNDRYELIKKNVNKVDGEKILAKRIKGVFLKKKTLRKYPFLENSSKVIGFVDYKGDGIYGIEKYYNDILNWKKTKDLKNIFVSFFEKKNFKKKILINRKGNLFSSINLRLSAFVEKELKKVEEKYQSKYSGMIIMKVSTGEIIAMVDTENFNLNENKKPYRNNFVENRIEVGSIFKPLVATIALDARKIKKNFVYHGRGCLKVLTKKICNFDKKDRGAGTTLQKIISKSLNTGMIEIERAMGHEIFFKYLLKLGASEESGIDLPDEISSTIFNLNNNNDVNYATASFGQGISFTPIGILKLLNTIPNDGKIISPRIINKIEYGGLIPDTVFVNEAKQIFSKKYTQIMTNILINRADEFYKNKSYAFNKDYSVAAKTGTAQIASPDGTYFEKKNIHTFFGFFPAKAKIEDRYSVLIYTVEPKKVRFSSETLPEPFYNIVNFMIPEFNIKPDNLGF